MWLKQVKSELGKVFVLSLSLSLLFSCAGFEDLEEEDKIKDQDSETVSKEKYEELREDYNDLRAKKNALEYQSSVLKSQKKRITDKYNTRTDKYNKRVSKAYELDKASRATTRLMNDLDENFSKLLSTKNDFIDQFSQQNIEHTVSQLDDNEPLEVQITDIDKVISSALQTVLKLEKVNLEMMKSIEDNSEIYKNEHTQRNKAQNLIQNFKARGEQLEGFRDIILDQRESIFNVVKAEITVYATRHNQNKKAEDALDRIEDKSQKQKKIELSEKEKQVKQQTAGSTTYGTYAGQHGTHKVIKGNSVEDYVKVAEDFGINTKAVRHSYSLSHKTGGSLGLAETYQQIPSVITENFFTDIKDSMNQNRGDLELVFLIDYSGSMEQEIESVINSLKEMTRSLDAIRRAGRDIEISVVTFNQPELEEINLPFTSNFADVQITLSSLLENFHNDKNYVNPGEARYYGLREAIDKLKWNALNRNIILMTDEPSYIKEDPRPYDDYNKTVKEDKVLTDLKRNGIQTKIYNLVVPKS